jgi:hypothetical protein
MYDLQVVLATRFEDGDEVAQTYFSIISYRSPKVVTDYTYGLKHVHALPLQQHASVSTYTFYTMPALIQFVRDATGDRSYNLLTILADVTSALEGCFVWHALR